MLNVIYVTIPLMNYSIQHGELSKQILYHRIDSYFLINNNANAGLIIFFTSPLS